jgi:hypothetical protein
MCSPGPVAPNACSYCDIEQREHFMRWALGPGLHTWIEPSNTQRLVRMKGRRTRKNRTEEEK